jgi:hypothetical protein
VTLVLLLAAALALIGWSLNREIPFALRVMKSEHDAYAQASWEDRQQLFGARVPLPMNVFDFYRSGLRAGDRYYFDVLESGFGFATLRETVRNVGHLYLLPAVEVERIEDADVILSWQKDPVLGLQYSEQLRLGLQPFFVSRVAR